MNLEILFKGSTEGDQLKKILKKIGSPNESTLKKYKSLVTYE